MLERSARYRVVLWFYVQVGVRVEMKGVALIARVRRSRICRSAMASYLGIVVSVGERVGERSDIPSRGVRALLDFVCDLTLEGSLLVLKLVSTKEPRSVGMCHFRPLPRCRAKQMQTEAPEIDEVHTKLQNSTQLLPMS